MDVYLQRQICERIKRARQEAGLTQEEMAHLLNVTIRGYQNYESIRVPFRALDKIAQFTGVTQEWLLRGDPPEQEAVLVRDVADAVATLEESAESAHSKLDELLVRLARLEAGLLPPEAEHKT